MPEMMNSLWDIIHLGNPYPAAVMRNITLVLGSVILSLTLVLACGQKEEPAKTKKPHNHHWDAGLSL
jgi:hypothetical protein